MILLQNDRHDNTSKSLYFLSYVALYKAFSCNPHKTLVTLLITPHFSIWYQCKLCMISWSRPTLL